MDIETPEPERAVPAPGGLADRWKPIHLWLLTLGCVVVSLLLAPQLTCYSDFACYWLPWAKSTHGYATWEMYTHDFLVDRGQRMPCNYMPFVPYLLTVFEAIRLLFGIPDLDFNAVLLLKAFFIVAHAAGGPLCWYGLRRPLGERKAKTAAALYLICLPFFVNAALWGQADTLLCLALIAVVIALLNDRPVGAGGLFGWALLVKLQAIALVPVVLAYVMRRFGAKRLLQAAAAGAAVLILGALPIVLGGGGHNLLLVLTRSAGYYPQRTMTAANFWFLADIVEHRVRHIPPSVILRDDVPWLGSLTAREVGSLVFGLYLLVIAYGVWRRRESAVLLYGCTLSFLGFYMLPTEMHERYVLPAVAFAAIGAAADSRLRWLYAVFFIVAAADQFVMLVLASVSDTMIHSWPSLFQWLVYNGSLLTGPAYMVTFFIGTIQFLRLSRATAAPPEG